MKTPKIIFQDSHILVINKPSGLVVNRAESVKGKTLQDWMEEKYEFKDLKSKEKSSFYKSAFYKRSGVVHRLDKDTSGVMVLAKNTKAFTDLQKQFKQRKVHKKYLALVHGKVEPKAGDIKRPLGRKPTDRKKFTVRLGGKMSETKYQVLKIYDQYSLLGLEPKTGRTHQLRVHLKHIGYPIVADPIYLGRKTLKQDKQWCPRLFLHAHKISFLHPQTKKRTAFEAPLSEKLELILKNRLDKKVGNKK